MWAWKCVRSYVCVYKPLEARTTSGVLWPPTMILETVTLTGPEACQALLCPLAREHQESPCLCLPGSVIRPAVLHESIALTQVVRLAQ